MKDEIKKILVRSKEQQALDDLKALANAKEDEEVYIEYGLNTKARILLDYITNLQEEKDSIDDYARHLHNENKALQEENKILKENAIHNDKVVDKAKWNEMLYKSRNEKAIEYIKFNLDKNAELIQYFNYDANFNKLLNILNGGDE